MCAPASTHVSRRARAPKHLSLGKIQFSYSLYVLEIDRTNSPLYCQCHLRAASIYISFIVQPSSETHSVPLSIHQYYVHYIYIYIMWKTLQHIFYLFLSQYYTSYTHHHHIHRLSRARNIHSHTHTHTHYLALNGRKNGQNTQKHTPTIHIHPVCIYTHTQISYVSSSVETSKAHGIQHTQFIYNWTETIPGPEYIVRGGPAVCKERSNPYLYSHLWKSITRNMPRPECFIFGTERGADILYFLIFYNNSEAHTVRVFYCCSYGAADMHTIHIRVRARTLYPSIHTQTSIGRNIQHKQTENHHHCV